VQFLGEEKRFHTAWTLFGHEQSSFSRYPGVR
jgi:hypothetical protein